MASTSLKCSLTPCTRVSHSPRPFGGAQVAASARRVSCASSRTDEGNAATIVSKRELLCLLPAAALASTAFAQLPAEAKVASGDWSSPGLAAPEDDAAPKFFKTASGVKVQELAAGAGQAAQMGDAVLIDYVLRRANGYFIYSTVDGVSFQPSDVPTGPLIFKLGDGKLIPGLEEVLVGMAPGAKRRALVPPEVGYQLAEQEPQMPTFATKRQLEVHRREPLLFEVQVLKVRPS